LETLALSPKESDRRSEKLLYFRDSTSIEDLFTHMGITQATFAVMDKKIERGMRNDANRLANCDANNISKAIAVSMRQTELIRRLIEENKISFLPPKLEKTARLRLEYEGLSVGQLAEMENPPLTKSGLHHRLEKITELAETLLEEKKGGV
jgi:DNA-binding protein WhiA